MALVRDPESIRLCNCCYCRCTLLGSSEHAWWSDLTEQQRGQHPPLVAGRIAGRPYCGECLRRERGEDARGVQA